MTARSNDRANRSIHEHRPCTLGAASETFGHSFGTMNNWPCFDRRECRVLPKHNIGI